MENSKENCYNKARIEVLKMKKKKRLKLKKKVYYLLKDDVIKIVRLYFLIWRIEEYFRAKKQMYDFENIRLRTLKGMNNLNLFLTIHLGHINQLTEEINLKLLSIKIIEESK